MRSLLILATLIAPSALLETLGIENGKAIGLFISVVILWLTEWLPLAVTGLLIPVFLVVLGLSPSKQAFSAFGNEILFLFIGCFFLAQSMEKHGWDKRMAYWLLSSKLNGRTASSLITMIGGICFVLSMWISNTATAAMMTPICLGIINTLETQFSDPSQHRRFSTRLLLTMAFASSIGGLATPVGTPPNLIALQFLKENGISISFLQWLSFGLPIAAAMFGVLIVIMRIKFPVEPVNLNEVRQYFQKEFAALGSLKTAEVQVAAVFTLTVLLWLLPSIAGYLLPNSAWAESLTDYLPMTVVGIGAALLLFILRTEGQPNLTWQDAQKIDWGTIMLFGGGLTLGRMLSNTGLAEDLGKLVFDPSWGILALISGAVLIGIVMSEFSSNTASASIVIPILLTVLAMEGFENINPTVLIMACAFGASYGFMLPVSTPPNAIAFGTGKLRVKDMFRCGILFDIAGAILIIGGAMLFQLIGFPNK